MIFAISQYLDYFFYMPPKGVNHEFIPREITFNQISITLSKGNYIIKTKL